MKTLSQNEMYAIMGGARVARPVGSAGPWDNPGDPGSPDDPSEVLDEEEVPT